jgi:DNA-binding MarR family transcriptional regulator
MSQPGSSRDEPVQQRTRLGILAILVEASSSQFRFLRDTLQLTDGNLSRYLGVLEAASLVKIARSGEGRPPRTSVLITRTGRKAFAAEIAAIRRVIDQLGDAPGSPNSTQSGADESGGD